MIRAGMPLPLMERLRQLATTLRLRWANRVQVKFARLSEGMQASWRRMFFVAATHRRTLDKERRVFQSFLAEFDGMVDILCMAAREDAPELYRNAYITRQKSYREQFRSVRDGLRPYWQEWALEADPFVVLGEGKIEEMINSVSSIETMMTLQGILEAYQEHLDTAVA